jgi:UDP-N-acetylmuramyl pentapeptide synthase
LIDDSYNSNPTSLFASLENFVSLAKGRKIAVLGDMLELGKDAAFWHRKAGESLPQEINLFFLVGKLVREIARGAIRNGLDRSRVQCFESHDELNFYLKNSLKPGDWVLVKGSRGMGMERIIEEMEKMR